MDKNAPKYISVYNSLKSDLLSGRFHAGSFLPPEDRLCELYEASRTTVRHAVALLKEEQFLDVRQGRGTVILPVGQFVSQYRFFESKRITHMASRFLVNNDATITSQGAIIDIVPAETGAANALGLEYGTNVYRLQRVKIVNNTVFSYVVSYVRCDVTPGLERFSGQVENLYDLLKAQYGISFLSGEQVVTAVLAGFVESKLLSVNPGTPLLVFRRTAFFNDIPFEYSESFNRPDVIEVFFEISPAVKDTESFF